MPATRPYPTISTKDLPPADSATFSDTSFFARNGPGAQLPSPADVRAKSAIQDPEAHRHGYGFSPVRYEDLGLIVKFGRAPELTVDEGQCLWVLCHILPEVPVPEVYGWTHDDGQIFIFMELVKGVTLEQRWDSLDQAERESVCGQLRIMLSELRKVRHAPGELFIGHVNHEPPRDIIFETSKNDPPAGPFHSVTEFHDWISILIRTGLEHHWPGKEPSEIPDPYRNSLPDNAAVVLTHGDLHPSNIMVSADSPCKVVALIDWHQSGWYPDYWEYCKAAFTAETAEWLDEYIPLFLDDPRCVDAWDYYARALGY